MGKIGDDIQCVHFLDGLKSNLSQARPLLFERTAPERIGAVMGYLADPEAHFMEDLHQVQVICERLATLKLEEDSRLSALSRFRDLPSLCRQKKAYIVLSQ
jgi:hypothetical protein